MILSGTSGRKRKMNGLGCVCVSVFHVCFVCSLKVEEERGESCMIMYYVMDGWMFERRDVQVNPIAKV